MKRRKKAFHILFHIPFVKKLVPVNVADVDLTVVVFIVVTSSSSSSTAAATSAGTATTAVEAREAIVDFTPRWLRTSWRTRTSSSPSLSSAAACLRACKTKPTDRRPSAPRHFSPTIASE